MATSIKKTDLGNIVIINPGTQEHEQLLGVGYGGMTVKKAEAIVAEREKNPALWPYEKYEQAQAFLEAYKAKLPKPVSLNDSPMTTSADEQE